MNEFKDGASRWPQEFDGKVYLIQDKLANYYYVILKVRQAKKEEFAEDVNKPLASVRYVVVYPSNPRYPNGKKHCVFAESLQHGEISGVNSWGPTDQYPRINIHETGISFYQIS